ncbi:SARP family transcriptional regulator [Geodermatophilus sp. YIM 151500]|uniref:AfsR/SARP family transcriptional regulator n=1 Tax=Geodermatophilus sp. YIM 151500 TaxID=2984531 RepID=UPI0021E4B0AC|nr:BTAD domain-containing putative transcriptional regulator [Geodermatophilus sp. YIM 151500]MCV2487810.1 SARP family transcriptional regulator [Geodermatophilus sp. YIM 151500]
MDATAHVRIGLLDGFTLQPCGRPGGAAVEDLPHGVQRLVALLGLVGRPTRTAVAGSLWPDVPEEQAHGSLRSALWRLQKVVPGLVEVSGGALALAAGVRVDVRELAEWARAVLDPGTPLDDLLVPDVGPRGELLPGWYDDWVIVERERLRQLRMHALEALAGRLADGGRYGEAVQAAYAAVRAEPLRESAHRAVVRVHLAEGNLAEALRAYHAFRTLLDDELGVAPSAQMDGLVAGLCPRQRPVARLARVPAR